MSVNKPIFGLIGDGRLARHLAHYFLLLDHPHEIRVRRWSRRMLAEQGLSWQAALKDCDTILLAVSDHAIEPLAAQIRATPGFEDRTLIHFSGALFTDQAWGFHPLMTFSATLYSLDQYQRIPFLIDQDAPALSEIFPRLKNPSARVSREKKSLYHAWCVMGGNFTAFLWTRMFEAFSAELGLDPALAVPYLRQTSENLLKNPGSARDTWTGPIVRKDHKTIEAHLEALSNHPYKTIYRAFLEAHTPEIPESNERNTK